MQTGENIISRIIDLDVRAESIRVQAGEEAVRIQSEAVREAEEQKQSLEIQTAERVKLLAAEAARKRTQEVDKVKKEYANQVEGIRTISSEKKDRAALIVLSGMRGRSE
ncbi:MAG: hypothetical protein Q8O92_01660 [Candidatus Latescibacter sp.]|nr:hypothetical protein [Candidatus Latescibacter sp.]